MDFNVRHLTQLIAENSNKEKKFIVINKGGGSSSSRLSSSLSSSSSAALNLPESSSNIERTVLAPPGKLGIILIQSQYGCMIQSVKSESPMLGILLPGDLILSFNDIVGVEIFCHLSDGNLSTYSTNVYHISPQDVLGLNVRQLTHLMSENINTKKKFTVVNKSGRSSSSSFSSSHNDDKYFIPCKATRTKLRNVQFTVPVDQ